MNQFYKQERIYLGPKIKKSGHLVYTNAIYTSENDHTLRFVYKENKNGKPELTRYEAAFGELARLFLPLDLTPKQMLVKDRDDRVVGLGCEYLTNTIERREGLNKTFYRMQPGDDGEFKLTPLYPAATNDIPFQFFYKFPPGFFKKLSDAARRGEISLDLGSLAAVLATSYSLEEDDLHKGNLGFYVVQKEGKPHVVFFKIDHDFMMADSVMSHMQARFLNWFNGSDAFKVTARDLINFPRLTDSQNYYWPTTKRFFSLSNRNAYTSDDEVNAFSALASSPEFCQHKWQQFYKHVLIPPELIARSLSMHLNYEDPTDRAKISLITQSVVARQAKLRAVLFTIPEFREFVVSANDTANAELVQNIVSAVNDEQRGTMSAEITEAMTRHKNLCASGCFALGDTPLHAALRLQDYRYQETIQSFKQFLNQKNDRGEAPLDLAVELTRKESQQSVDIRADAHCALKHLLNEGAVRTQSYQDYKAETGINPHNYVFHTGYSTLANQTHTAAELRNVLRNIGEDHRYSLKMQKEMAVLVVRKFVEHNQQNPKLKEIVEQLKADLNGTKTTPPLAELQYIRQLRSQLWIVRIFRGLFGYTSTQAELNQVLNKALTVTPNVSACRATFYGRPNTSNIEDGPEPEPPRPPTSTS